MKCLNCFKGMIGGRVEMLREFNFLFVVEVLKEVREVVVIMVELLFFFGCIFWLEKRLSKGFLFLIFIF